MKNLYQPNKPSTKGRRLLLFTTVLVVLLFTIDMFAGGIIRDGVHGMGASIYTGGVGAVGAVGNTGFFSTRRGLEERIASLSDDVARLNEQIAETQVLRDENAELRKIVSLASKAEGVTAPVVSSFRTSPYGTFLVGAGTEDGAQRGHLVISPGGFVIGTVSDVGPHTAIVTAVFAPDASIDATIAGSATLVEGRGAGNARARMPHGITVEKGDPVFSPGFGGRPIGVVGSTESDSASAYTDVYIGLPVSVESLRYVYIEK